uniref:Putative ATPase domain containing protein n=1 Tax=viral metagenome TaxID=1070528 RepID=A0A6M3J0L5_9ZZZZ
MSKYRSTKSQTQVPDKYASRKKRMDSEQVVKEVKFTMEEQVRQTNFEDSISALFGIPGIGKSMFAAELGLALKEKYQLPYSGTYFIQVDPINHSRKIRMNDELVDTWPTFRHFVDEAEKNPKFVETVKMWVIDTLDGLVPKGISTICSDFGITDLREATRKIGNDGWSAEAWQELKYELRYQILRLAALGPGVLLLSHERYRKVQEGGLEVEKASMDVSNSIYNAIGNDCSIIMRMRLESGRVKRPSKSTPRCLAVLSSLDEDAKENLGVVTAKYENGIVPFTTEREAVDKILACFGTIKTSQKVSKKTVKKPKKVRK